MTSTERGRAGVPELLPSERIATALRERIASRDLPPGAEVPTMRELQDQYGGAKDTITRALSHLRSEGLLETRAGMRTRVVDRRAALSPMAQYERVRRTGLIRLGNEDTVILERGQLDAADLPNIQIRETLELTEQSGKVIYRNRKIKRDGNVEYIVTSYIPSVYFSMRPGWPATRDRLLSSEKIGQSTFKLMAELVDEELDREEYNASASVANGYEAMHLRINPGSPVMRVVTAAFSESGLPLECGIYTYGANSSVRFPAKCYRPG